MSKKLNSAVKRRAWNRFAEYIRVRDCIKTTGCPFVGRCVTCGKRFHIRALQAGHCFPGRKNGRLFDERLVNAQCVLCNERHHGRRKEYRAVMEARYTKEKVALWEIEGNRVIHDRDMDFEGKAAHYIEEMKKLLAPFGYPSYKVMLKDE